MAKYLIKKGGKTVREVFSPPEDIHKQIVEGEEFEFVEDEPERNPARRKLEALASELAKQGVSIDVTVNLNTKELAKAAIDQAAGRARVRHVSTGSLIDEEYRQVRSQVQEWRAGGSKNKDVPPMLSVRADILGVGVEEAAQDIEQAINKYTLLFEATFRIRLEGKKAVDLATEEFDVIAKDFILQLDAL